MLTLKNITKSYPGRGMVLSDLHLVIEDGETVAITGPSGSGKTTLLNIIGLLDRPESGQLKFNGIDAGEMNLEESALYRHDNIGFVFQEHLLLPYLSVIENIELPLLASPRGSFDAIEKKEYIMGLMQKCGIDDLADKLPGKISGGEAQRATLVRALVNRPSLLLADEPTGSLDRKNSGNLADLLLEMNLDYQVTIITVTHSIELAKKMNRILELREGSLFPVT